MDMENLFCRIYDRNLNEMLANINDAKNDKEKLKILTIFAKKFTMLPDQQSELLRISKLYNQDVPKNINNCLYSTKYGDKNQKHIEWSNRQEIIDKLYDETDTKRFHLAEEAFTFPHKWLEEIDGFYFFNLVKPQAKAVQKQFKRSKKIYDKLKESENDMDKWLECINKIENKEAIIANLELKLGQKSNWKNGKLWKFYFNFLKENNMKEILEVFRKYIRLFICDKQAVTQYRNELDKYSSWNIPTTKYWIDTIKYQIEFGKLQSAYRILERAVKAVIGKPYHLVVKNKNDLCDKLKKFEKEMMEIEEVRNLSKVSKCQVEEKTVSSKPTVYYQNPKHQHLCFRRSFIQNLLKNANATVLKKLYSTCKFFFSFKAAPLCYRLEINGSKKARYCQEALYVNKKDINFDGFKNLHLYHGLILRVNLNRNIIPRIVPKIKICNIRYMDIRKQDFAVSEFCFMLSKNIFQILLHDVNINDENGKNIHSKKLFKILKLYPSLHIFIYINQKSFIVASHFDFDHRIRVWREMHQNFHFETIYIVKQTISDLDLQELIDFQLTRFITLKRVFVKNENGNKMENEQLKTFVSSKINPNKNVSVTIV